MIRESLFDMHEEVNKIDKEERYNTHDRESKFMCLLLVTGGILEKIVRIQLIEYNEIVEHDRRWYLDSIYVTEIFTDELIEVVALIL